jgi:hypothetical protein
MRTSPFWLKMKNAFEVSRLSRVSVGSQVPTEFTHRDHPEPSVYRSGLLMICIGIIALLVVSE